MPEHEFLISGERAALGLLRREQLPRLAAWFNDPDVRRGLAHRGIVNEDAETAWYEHVTEAARQPRPAEVAFAIHDAADGELVGVCGLENIDHNFSRGEFGIFLGQRRGTGIGTDATRLALDWAFTIIGLHNVMLESYQFNEQAIRAYQRAGFRVIGTPPRRRARARTSLGLDPDGRHRGGVRRLHQPSPDRVAWPPPRRAARRRRRR